MDRTGCFRNLLEMAVAGPTNPRDIPKEAGQPKPNNIYRYIIIYI